MNISYKWLKDYINIDLDPQEVSSILTSIGLEVEAVETYEDVKGGMEGLVIGKVLTCEKHPNADKLSVTTVDIGRDASLHIVCGAPNVAKGQTVVVAPVGTTLYKGNESLTLQKVKIRGELSEGMICAEDEIGIGTSHAGIIVLDDNVQVGIPAKEYYKVESDTVFTIGLTPNRIDAASHYGVARDLAAYLSQHKDVKLTPPDTSSFKVDSKDYPVEVVIENPSSCKRYAGVTVTGIKVGPSPDWMQKRLKAIGLNPINNIVDITNYVLFESGKPLHAFDADKLKDKKIVVRNVTQGTKFITLDEKERELSVEDLMICDAENPVCIGGIFGGIDSGVSENTKNVFIESAYFNPVTTRRSAKRHGINTDSSFRFERGVDPESTIPALKRAAILMKEFGGGKISSEIVDVYPEPIQPFKVEVTYKNIDRLIGKKIDHNRIKKILNSLEIEILNENDDTLYLSVPAYRVDVKREADVIEDILRIYGYNKIEISDQLYASISYTAKPDKERIKNLISDYLSANGFNEIMCNSLTKSGYYDNLKSYPANNLVRIHNPLSVDLDVMRQTLLFGGLESVILNINHKNSDLALYEFGNCYFFDKKQNQKDPLESFIEKEHFAIFITGKKRELNWTSKDEPVTFFYLKTFVENLLQRIGVSINDVSTADPSNDIYKEGITYSLNGNTLAEFGSINKNLLKSFDIKSDVFYADLYFENILNSIKDHKITYSELLKYPEVKRDLALVLDQAVTYQQIKELAHKTEKKLLKDIILFDVYEGEQIEKGKKSYAVSFTIQDETKTLTDSEIDKVMNNLMKAYETVLKAKIRK